MLFSLTNAPYSYLSGTDRPCNISNLAPYYTAWFHFMPVLIYFHAYDLKEKNKTLYILWKYLKGCAKVWRRSPLLYVYYYFFSFPSASVISMVSHVTFLTNVFRKKKKYFSKQYHYLPFYSKPCIFTYIYQWCVFVIKQKIAVKASLCYIILWLFFEKLWRLAYTLYRSIKP